MPAAATWSKDEGNVGRATGLSWADFDGDGDADLTVISNWAAYLYVNSVGTLETDTLHQYFGSGTAAEGLIGWADVNGDDDLDLYGRESVMLAGPAAAPGPIGEGAAYIINGLDSIIEGPWRRQGSMFARVTHAADFNGDDAADLLTGYVNSVFLQQPGSFPPSVGPSVDSIEVSPAGPLTLTGAGATQAFTVTATYSDLSTADVTASTSFSVSSSMNDGTLIVRMTDNVAEAVNVGEASVRVSYLSRSAAVKVYVVAVDPVPVSIAVSPAAATLTREGETLTYTVAATLDNGETVDVTADSTIGSSDGAVATVSGDTATALAAGTATLTATYGALSDTASLEVAIAATLDSISVSPTTASIEVGERQGLEVAAHFSDGSTQTVTSFAVLTSSDPAVASVDGYGVVGEAVGSATITADYLGRSAPATVNVSARTGTQFSLSASSYTVSEATGSLQVTVRRIGDGVGATSIVVSTRDGSAAAPGDYTAITSQTLNWAAWNTDDQAVTVTVTSDAVSEPEEVFHVSLSSPAGGVLAPPFSAEVHVFDAPQEGTISLSGSSYVVGEGATYVEVTVSRTGGADGALSVDYATSDGGATAGADYTGVTSTLTWGDGDAADQVVQKAFLSPPYFVATRCSTSSSRTLQPGASAPRRRRSRSWTTTPTGISASARWTIRWRRPE